MPDNETISRFVALCKTREKERMRGGGGKKEGERERERESARELRLGNSAALDDIERLPGPRESTDN